MELNLRGLCQETILDTRFLLRHGQEGGKRVFTGNFGWTLSWEPSQKLWAISSVKYPGVMAFHVQSSEYPLGKKVWKIVNDTKRSSDEQETVLSLTPCNKDQYTCENGICIDMERRCDQRFDCEDVSDEKNCLMVSIDERNY